VNAERFHPIPPDRPADDLERDLLDRWRTERLFERSLEARAGAPPFVFFEGPPTANGRPGIHHVFSRTVKDLFCRHRHMRGHYVRRKAGWDTHGLPVEIEVEKALGISGKQEIEALGVAEFNRRCRESVFRYREEWEQLSERIAYWLDYGDAYITYANDYIESVWWALRTLHERGFLYRGHKILPYCPRCGTALSSHEVAQGYEDVEDPSVYVALALEMGDGRGEPDNERGSEERTADARAPRVTRLASRLQPGDGGGETGQAADSRVPGPRSTGTVPGPPGIPIRRLLVWTTTPWTLVSNVALAVHPDLDYVELTRRKGGDGTIILAEARAAAVLGADYTDRWDVVRRFTGTELVGRRYRRPLDWVDVPPAAGQREVIVAGDFVSADDGSGIVHLAPAFGADDYAMGQRHGLAFLQPVNGRGRFDDALPVVGGQWVKDADARIVEELERRHVLWKAGRLTHSYPHCWRCRTRLLYYARGSWFIRTTAYRDQMLARNARVDWHPEETGTGRFGEWLTNNIDWAISRDRYWGTPLPVWVCERNEEHVDVIGSYADLAARLGAALPADFDPHKPGVDGYTWPCPRCRDEFAGAGGSGDRGATGSAEAPRMRRVPEVIDTWFDSGAMSFAQWHYPFENRAVMASQYPADFIAEGVDQTRGWFYSLLAIATGLGDALPNNGAGAGTGIASRAETGDGRTADGDASRVAPRPSPTFDTAPYRAVVVNDLVLDAEGVKMAKSRGNVVNPWDVISRHGADAVRLFLVAASQLDVPRRFDEQAIRETAGRFLVTLKNVYSGIFAQYANFGWAPSAADPAVDRRPLIDRWILARTRTVEREVDRLLGVWDATAAARLAMAFLVDDVSNWYVRLNRSRLYEVTGDDNRAAFATLHDVLVVTCRLLAPFAPFVSDLIHRELTGSSVHLAPYVREDAAPSLPSLEAAMDELRELSRLGRAAREEAGIGVRWPLSRLLVVVPAAHADALRPLLPLLAQELNVKDVTMLTSADELVQLTARPNFRALGKRFGKGTPLAAKAIEAIGPESLRAFERGEPIAITVESHDHVLEPDDVTILRRAVGDLVVRESGGLLAAIDPRLTDSLRREGIAREVVSRVQRLRKDAKLAVSDRIVLRVSGDAPIEDAVREYNDWIAGEVLAREVVVDASEAGVEYATQTVEIDSLPVRLALKRDH
jgi:isoleucyl-tRNA synthetase